MLAYFPANLEQQQQQQNAAISKKTKQNKTKKTACQLACTNISIQDEVFRVSVNSLNKTT